MRAIFRIPFTLGFLLVMVTANWLAGTLDGLLPPQALRAWGISHQSILNGDAFRLITGTFLSHDFGMFVRQLCFAAVVIGCYETIEGTWRAVAVFFTIDVLGTLLVLFLVLPLLIGLPVATGEAELLTHDVGMSAGGFGLIGALAANQRHRWILLIGALLLITAKVWISFEAIADTAHMLCLCLGFILQAMLNIKSRTTQLAER
ncbi:MAG: hypothetical protein V7703_09660 [Hyphomicrobiales bacterium]